jgi:hypothetical protein
MKERHKKASTPIVSPLPTARSVINGTSHGQANVLKNRILDTLHLAQYCM